MKWLKFWTILKFTIPKRDANIAKYHLLINQKLIENLLIQNTPLHRQTYKLLRKFKTPQYNNAWLMRQKHGFNTLFFQQNYDIIICDRYGNVLDTFINQKKGYISNYYARGYFVYFMVVGSIRYYNIKNNDRLTFKRILVSFKIVEDLLGLK